MSDSLQAAEDVLAKWHDDTADIWALADCVEPLIKHARTLEDELARKTAVVEAQWEIVESFKKENAELRQAWEKVRAQIEAEVGGPDLSRSDGLRKALAILAQHAGAANRLDKGGAD